MSFKYTSKPKEHSKVHNKVINVCEKCGKSYSRQNHFSKHIEQCTENLLTIVEPTKSINNIFDIPEKSKSEYATTIKTSKNIIFCRRCCSITSLVQLFPEIIMTDEFSHVINVENYVTNSAKCEYNRLTKKILFENIQKS